MPPDGGFDAGAEDPALAQSCCSSCSRSTPRPSTRSGARVLKTYPKKYFGRPATIAPARGRRCWQSLAPSPPSARHLHQGLVANLPLAVAVVNVAGCLGRVCWALAAGRWSPAVHAAVFRVLRRLHHVLVVRARIPRTARRRPHGHVYARRDRPRNLLLASPAMAAGIALGAACGRLIASDPGCADRRTIVLRIVVMRPLPLL